MTTTKASRKSLRIGIQDGVVEVTDDNNNNKETWRFTGMEQYEDGRESVTLNDDKGLPFVALSPLLLLGLCPVGPGTAKSPVESALRRGDVVTIVRRLYLRTAEDEGEPLAWMLEKPATLLMEGKIWSRGSEDSLVMSVHVGNGGRALSRQNLARFFGVKNIRMYGEKIRITTVDNEKRIIGDASLHYDEEDGSFLEGYMRSMFCFKQHGEPRPPIELIVHHLPDFKKAFMGAMMSCASEAESMNLPTLIDVQAEGDGMDADDPPDVGGVGGVGGGVIGVGLFGGVIRRSAGSAVGAED